MTDPTENNHGTEPNPDEVKDYYEILGVSRDATETQIDEAVDRLQKELRRELDEALSLEEQQAVKDKFRELTDMYHVLTDSMKSRVAYDKKLQETKPQQEVAPKEELIEPGESETVETPPEPEALEPIIENSDSATEGFTEVEQEAQRKEQEAQEATVEKEKLETEPTGSEAIEPAAGEVLDPETVFYKKIDVEIATLIADYPPIEEDFIPDVKLFLQNTPKAERKEALVKFKENLVKQRIALAYCRTFIEEIIEFNNDISKEGLMVLVEEFNENYRFTQKQQEVLEKAIDRYIENRKNCLEIRNRYEDTPEGNTALIKELTGKDISEEEMKEVELSVGPMTINIRTTEDIAKKLAKKPKEQSFRGFSNSSSDKSVRYVIINRDMHDDTKVYSQEDTLQHEYEHLKYKIFKDIFESEINEEEVKNLKENYEQKTGPEQEIALRAYLGIEQEKVLQRVQEEITASMNDKSLNEIQEKIMPLFFKEDGEYDYLKPIRDSAFCKNLNQAEQKIYQEIIIDESKYIIARAISALITLQEEGKYSPKKIIGLLTDKPLRGWPKTTGRLLKKKRTQKET